MTAAPAGVVLAAGAGTRLRPLTNLRPKALCPVNGVPLVELALERLLPSTGAGPRRVAVNAHHLAEQLVAHVGGRAHVTIEQPAALGTAGALGGLREWLDGRDVVVTNADAYLTGGVDHLVTGWDGQRCRLLVAPSEGRGDFANGTRPVRYVGMCVLPWRLVRHLKPEPSGLYEMLWRTEYADGRIDLVRHAGTAIDCGSPSDYLAANLHASGGRSVVGAGAVVDGIIERCVVWDHAAVAANEHLVACVRAGTPEAPVTVSAGDVQQARSASPSAGQS